MGSMSNTMQGGASRYGAGMNPPSGQAPWGTQWSALWQGPRDVNFHPYTPPAPGPTGPPVAQGGPPTGLDDANMNVADVIRGLNRSQWVAGGGVNPYPLGAGGINFPQQHPTSGPTGSPPLIDPAVPAGQNWGQPGWWPTRVPDQPGIGQPNNPFGGSASMMNQGRK